MEYVIIGNSIAGVNAVEGIREVDREGRITLIGEEKYHVYGRPLISYWLEGKTSPENMGYKTGDFYERHGVSRLLGLRAIRIDHEKRDVELEDGRSIPYDRLLIATESQPFIPRVEGLEDGCYHTFIKLDDVIAIDKKVREGMRVSVVGGGLIGLKAAEALHARGAEITLIDLADRVLSSVLNDYLAGIVARRLNEVGLELILGNTLSRLERSSSSGDGYSLTLRDGRIVSCDLLVMAIGVVPRLELVRDLPVEKKRGIIVDGNFRTSIPHIYAAGDVIESRDLLSGASRVAATLPNAALQGRLAGRAMAGAPVEYAGNIQFNSLVIFDLNIMTFGHIEGGGPEEGYEILVSETASDSPLKARYRRLVLKGNRIVGGIFLNYVERVGLIRSLAMEGVDVRDFKNELLRSDFGFIHLSAEVRERVLGRVS